MPGGMPHHPRAANLARAASLVLVALAAFTPIEGRSAHGTPVPGDVAAVNTSAWPLVSASNQWLMYEAEFVLDKPGGAREALAVCRRAKRAGYHGLVLWDANLWERDLPPGYQENASALKTGLQELGFTLMLQMCPRGAHVARWSGDDSMLEPRPIDPDPGEKHYRYLCLAHPGIHHVWEAQLLRADQIYRPVGWLLQAYNEIRVAGSDERCRATGKNPGQLLREHLQQTLAMIRRVTPGREIALWGDMIDPYHNAMGGKYYHVNGSLAAGAGACDSQVIIFSWNDRPSSFLYWSERGNRQLLPIYYDHDDMSPAQEAALVRAAVRYPRSVIGWMFTSWRHQYREVEEYGAIYAPFFRPAR